MDGGNADSDHSLTWEDFYGSTTDLTPTLIGIFNSFLEPPNTQTDTAPKDATEIKPSKRDDVKRKMEPLISSSPSKDPRLIAGSIKLPGLTMEEPKSPDAPVPVQSNVKKSPPTKMSYVSRLKSFGLRKNSSNESKDEPSAKDNSDQMDVSKNGNVNNCPLRLSESKENIHMNTKVSSLNTDSAKVISKLNSEVIAKVESNRKQWSEKSGSIGNSFDSLSPNVKRMLSSVGEDNCPKTVAATQPKKSHLAGPGRSSGRLRQSNIPLMGTTSKITSSAEIGSSVDIYDKPANPVSSLTKINIRSNHPSFGSAPSNVGTFIPPTQSSLLNRVAKDWTPPKTLSTFTSDHKISSAKNDEMDVTVYDVPVNSSAIYDVPSANRKVTERDDLLPYIDQANETQQNLDNKDERLSEASNFKVALTTPAMTNGADGDLEFENSKENLESPQTVGGNLSHPKISGSTGDLLKNVSQPREEENRLNLPSLNQVVRPLSMSSIASSTSTSSSGAQNKGGANSAYLASIESLDDHSDMDNSVAYSRLNQNNGPTRDSTDGGHGGVNQAEAVQLPPGRPSTPPRPRYCDPNLSPLQRVCTEIVDTENIYVEDLRQVVEGYLYAWRERGTFSTEQLNDLFSNIEEIYHFNEAFSQHLNECNLEAVAIARCFVHHSSGFGIYTQYCTGYPGILAALAKLWRVPDSAQPLARQSALGHALPLGSYLLKPVQRILKYHLLLQNLVKQYKSDDTEYALHKMTGIAHHINDMKRRNEDAVRVQEIQSLLYGWSGQDLTTFGELCAEGTFRVFGAKAMRHAFLFDKILLLTKKKEYGTLAYKSHIMCNNLMLVESIQGQPLSFHVIPFDCPRMQVTLQARSIQHKREWTLLLKRVILENYNAVIPSHARQLVMELGQNKTDDDIIAEKSSTLMSHSSMRKQLSAPEYLEKRKLDRDRRKSFESGLRYKLKRPTIWKNQTFDDTLENDESEREQITKSNGFNSSHYLCAECSDLSTSNLNLCKDCDDAYICVDCIKSENTNANIQTDVCNKCIENKLQDDELGKSTEYEKPDIAKKINHSVDDLHHACCKCSRTIYDKSQYLSDEDRVNKNLSQSSEIISNFSHDLCERCNNPKISQNKFSTEKTKNIYDRLSDKNINKALDIRKTCLKCHEIRENITVTDSKSFNVDVNKKPLESTQSLSEETNKRISKDDLQTLNVPKMNSSRRKSEPGIANMKFDQKDSNPDQNISLKETSNHYCGSCGRKNLNCKHCGTPLLVKRHFVKNISDESLHNKKCKCMSLERERIGSPKNRKYETSKNSPIVINMYNAKKVPKKISKLKKNRALRHLTLDPTAKFYTDFSNDFGSDDVLHISESTDSINTLNSQNKYVQENDDNIQESTISINEIPTDMDEETYRSLIQKTDSFKKSEIEKDKLVSQVKQSLSDNKDINDGIEIILNDEKCSPCNLDSMGDVEDDVFESCDDIQHEKPLEQIISQLLMENREFQKILKRHQFRNTNNRRHQRLLKSHSNPEKILLQSKEAQHKMKPKFGRQTSAVETIISNTADSSDSIIDVKCSKDNNADDEHPQRAHEEHIYETLIVIPNKDIDKNDSAIGDVDDESCLKSPDVISKIKIEEPTIKNKLNGIVPKQIRVSLTESDYVYLCFDGKKQIDAYKLPENISFDPYEDDGQYAVPCAIPQKVKEETIEIRNNKINAENNDANKKNSDDYYENTSEIWKRISNDTVIENKNFRKTDLDNQLIQELDTDGCPQSPNLPKIWLNLQKEHFSTPREKKSGSLPRSFQIVLNDIENKPNIAYHNKPGALNKVYLNKDGKVLQTDRPFTIASDHSEISYEDIERFIKTNEHSELKFPSNHSLNKSTSSFFEGDNLDDTIDSLSRSTLELEAEIDKCYKNRFGLGSDQLKIAVSNNLKNSPSHIQGIDCSISSSMEVINDKIESETSQEDINGQSLHPEHKIYKPNTNILSFKSVLNRFKSKNRSSSEHINIEEGADQKTSQKKLSPKTIQKTFLQRFKSRSDEQTDNTEPTEIKKDHNINDTKGHINLNNPTVLITSTDDSPEFILSKSFCDNNLPGKNMGLEFVSKSCNNISSSKDVKVKTPSMTQSAQFTIPTSNLTVINKSSKSNLEINKLPIYKQGSRLLGARIAQSDYADPKVLMAGSNSDLNKVNMLINKTALRPDSVLSNSSHFTSSSDGCFVPSSDANKNTSFLHRNKTISYDNTNVTRDLLPSDDHVRNSNNDTFESKINSTKTNLNLRSDESFFEKSFEEIENLYCNEIFRDSAIYSDPDDNFPNDVEIKFIQDSTNIIKPVNSLKNDVIVKPKTITLNRYSKINMNSTQTDKKYNDLAEINRVIISTEKKETNLNNELHIKSEFNVSVKERCLNSGITAVDSNKKDGGDKTSPIKLAPPVPVKPLICKNIHQTFKQQTVKSTISNISVNIYNNVKHNEYVKLETSSFSENKNTDVENAIQTDEDPNPNPKSKIGIPRPNFQRSTSSNVNLKRMSLERCSLDSSSISRRSKSVSLYKIENPISVQTEELSITKSVQERKKEIEMLSECNDAMKHSVQNRKSLDRIEQSSMILNRSFSVKSNNPCTSSSVNNSIAYTKVISQKCNIPTRSANIMNSENTKATDNSVAFKRDDSINVNTSKSIQMNKDDSIENCDSAKGGWVKQVVNRFQ